MTSVGRLWPGWVTVALTVAVCAFAGAASAQEVGRIEGQIVNGTAGSSPPAGLPITVHVFQDRTKVGERTAQTDERGAFSVEGLATGPAYVYFPVADYGGVGYFPERPIALDDAPQKRVEIRVFEPTSSEDVIEVERANLLLLRVTPTELMVMEMGAVLNRSDRAYVGDGPPDVRPPTLRFSLPRGADQVTPQAGLSRGELLPTPDGFLSTEPVIPGRHELAFSYQVPIEDSTLDLVKRHEYPTAAFNLYVPDTGISVLSPQLTFQGTSELGGQRYQLYTAQALPPGAQVTARLSGLPAVGGPRPEQLGLIVLGASAIVLGGAGVLAVRRRRKSADGAETPHEPASDGPAERLRLVRALAELDERFSAGEIDEEWYRAERSRGKERLLAVSGAAPRVR